MGIKELIRLGGIAEDAKDVVEGINSLDNSVLGPIYDTLLTLARTKTGNPTIMLANLTDNQVNIGLLEGKGDASDANEMNRILASLERVVLAIRAETSGNLPDVNI